MHFSRQNFLKYIVCLMELNEILWTTFLLPENVYLFFFFNSQIFVNYDKSVVIVIFLIATTIFNELNEIIFQKMFRILPQLNKNI